MSNIDIKTRLMLALDLTANDVHDKDFWDVIVKAIEQLRNQEGFQGSLHCKTKGCDGLIDADYCARCRKNWES